MDKTIQAATPCPVFLGLSKQPPEIPPRIFGGHVLAEPGLHRFDNIEGGVVIHSSCLLHILFDFTRRVLFLLLGQRVGLSPANEPVIDYVGVAVPSLFFGIPASLPVDVAVTPETVERVGDVAPIDAAPLGNGRFANKTAARPVMLDEALKRAGGRGGSAKPPVLESAPDQFVFFEERWNWDILLGVVPARGVDLAS